MAELLNKAKVEGMYDDETAMWMETELTVQMVAVQLKKEADHTIWGEGELTYTITVTNNETVSVTDVELVDTLEFLKVDFVQGSVTVMVGGTPVEPVDSDYDPATGILTVTVGEIPAGAEAVVTFRVDKKP